MKVGLGNVVSAGCIVNLVSEGSLPEHRKVKSLPGYVEVETPGPVRSSVTYAGTVVIADLSVFVVVHETNVSRHCIRHKEFSVCIDVGVNFVHILEDSVGLVSVEERERHSVLCS